MKRLSPFRNESRSFSAIHNPAEIRTALVIRLHATGDVAITLPYCVALKNRFPQIEIDYLVAHEAKSLPSALTIFRNVYVMRRSDSRTGKLAEIVRTCSAFGKASYNVVIDFQRNWISRIVRFYLHPPFWGEFDRFNPLSASKRTQATLAQMGFGEIQPSRTLPFQKHLLIQARETLLSRGWNDSHKLIVFNPAGFWLTRNWPMDSYLNLARRLLARENVSFLLLGTERIAEKADVFEGHFPSRVLNFSGQTSLDEAFSLLQFADGIISEDSGLMHMAWASGIPTVALFGSTNHVWSSPEGPHTKVFHSGDLECGDCMKPTCIHGDVRCLTRLSPEVVAQAVSEMIHATV